MYFLKEHSWTTTILPTGEIQLAIVKDYVQKPLEIPYPTKKKKPNTKECIATEPEHLGWDWSHLNLTNSIS